MLPLTSLAPVSLRPGTTADLPAIRALLAGAGLPVLDVDRATQLRFWLAVDGPRVVGVVGLERCASAGLVRSLAVAPGDRQRGVGQRLVGKLEQEAAASGIAQLVLLTQTADAFFRRSGYEVLDRALVPDGIRATEEFTTLCPASARCLAKSLATPGRGESHA